MYVYWGIWTRKKGNLREKKKGKEEDRVKKIRLYGKVFLIGE